MVICGKKEKRIELKRRGGEITHANVCHWSRFPDNRSGARFDKSNVLHFTQSATLQPECDSYANYNSLIRHTFITTRTKPDLQQRKIPAEVFFKSLLLSNRDLNSVSNCAQMSEISIWAQIFLRWSELLCIYSSVQQPLTPFFLIRIFWRNALKTTLLSFLQNYWGGKKSDLKIWFKCIILFCIALYFKIVLYDLL